MTTVLLTVMLMLMMVMNKMTPGKRLARGPRVVDHVDGNGGGKTSDGDGLIGDGLVMGSNPSPIIINK